MQHPVVDDPNPIYDPDRDPRIDHASELYPPVEHAEDMSDVLTQRRGQPAEQVAGANVDDDGVAHFLLITPDPAEPDICGGCKVVWPCDKRVGVQVGELIAPDPGEARLREIALDAARAALAERIRRP